MSQTHLELSPHSMVKPDSKDKLTVSNLLVNIVEHFAVQLLDVLVGS